jgi:hypothetical protein
LLLLSGLGLGCAALIGATGCKRDEASEHPEGEDASGDGEDGGKVGPGAEPWTNEGAGTGASGGTGLPAPQTLCEHVAGLVDAESGPLPPDERRMMIEDCTAAMVSDHARFGDEFYRKVSECVLAARDMTQLMACSAEPTGEGGEAAELPEDVEIPEELAPERLCRHMIDLMRAEDPDVAAVIVGENIDAFVEACAADVIEQIRVRGLDGYLEEARCALQATTVDDLDACSNPP